MEVTPARPRPCRGPRAGFRSRRFAFLPALLTALAIAPGSAGAGETAEPARILRVATSGDYAPFSFRRPGPATASGPELDGFDIAVATLFARDRGYRLEFVAFRWPDLARELAAASFDVAMSGVTRRADRTLAGRFSVPVAATHAVALTWKGSGVSTFEELDRAPRRVAVNAGGHLEKVASEVFRRAEVVALADNDAVRMAMLDRTFDAVVTENLEARVWTGEARDVIRIGPLSDDRKAYLLPADRRELAMELDLWLVAREKDGTLARLRRQYFGEAGADEAGGAATAEPFAALADAIVERLALMPMVHEAKKGLAAPVEDKEREAAVLDEAVRAVAAAASLWPSVAAGHGASTTDPGVAAAPPPQPDQVRVLFEALMSAGRDVQARLAEAEARRRRPASAGAASPQDGSSPSVEGEKESAGVPAGAGAQTASPEAPSPQDAVRLRASLELSGRIRPAIGRVSDKIACILVSMDEEISMRDARRRLGNLLAPHAVKPEHIDAVAAAAAQISSRGAGR